MIPCALCDMQFKLALPEPDEIQFTVIGMALGLGDPVKMNKSKKKPITHSMSKDQVKKQGTYYIFFIKSHYILLYLTIKIYYTFR